MIQWHVNKLCKLTKVSVVIPSQAFAAAFFDNTHVSPKSCILMRACTARRVVWKLNQQTLLSIDILLKRVFRLSASFYGGSDTFHRNRYGLRWVSAKLSNKFDSGDFTCNRVIELNIFVIPRSFQLDGPENTCKWPTFLASEVYNFHENAKTRRMKSLTSLWSLLQEPKGSSINYITRNI